MVAVASCFAYMLALIDCTALLSPYGTNRPSVGPNGFSCWERFVGLLFCQVGSAHSLREMCGGLATALGKLVHLGMRRAPTRSIHGTPHSISTAACPVGRSSRKRMSMMSAWRRP
jgi:hypothetical protein